MAVNKELVGLATTIGVAITTIFLLILFNDKSGSTANFIHRGPSPEARAVEDALVSLGGMPMFVCDNYKMAVGDMLEASQVRRLCRDGVAVLDGPISECLCGMGAPETSALEDQDVLTALEDLGFDFETREEPGIGNVTMRVPGAFNLTLCRDRLCPDNSCPDLQALQAHLCDKDGDPRYGSNTAECVCLNAPPPPPTMCSPGETLPVIRNETMAGVLRVTQSNSSITVNVTLNNICFQQPRVYIGAVRSIVNPPYPFLPGSFPTESWEQEISVEADGEGPARFGLVGHGFPPEWNHPDAPTFECGHRLYLRWAALSKPALPSGECPSVMHSEGWVPAVSDPMAFTYTFCCV
jgi:hypothetical protein